MAALGRLARRAAAPLAVFAASRLAVLAAAYITTRILDTPILTDVLGRWDGAWYMTVAERGYPASVPAGAGDAAQSAVAFFPVYPLLIRGCAGATGLARESCGVLTSMAAGAAAAVALWFLAERLAGESAAARAVALLSFFPGAYALSMVYPEGVFYLLAAVCLLALIAERWWVAGAAAALAGATRPNGIVLAACCAWAAGIAIRRRREWRALAAPLLAPAGLVLFFAYLYAHTGDPLIWARAQSHGWGQGFDGGLATLRAIGDVLRDPLLDLNKTIPALTLAAAIALFVLLWRWQPPAVLTIYSVGIVLPTVTSGLFTLTPRNLMTALPLLIAAARRLDGAAFAAAVAVSASLMAALTVLAGSTTLFTP